MTVLRIEGLMAGHGAHPVFNDFAVEIPPGLIGVVGPNGAGKSTLLSVLAGALPFEHGVALLDDVDLLALSPRERSDWLSYLPQNPGYAWNLPVADFIMLGQSGVSLEGWQEQLLEQLEIDHLLARPFHALSGGEQQRGMLAHALWQPKPLILLDEPLSGLDVKHQLRLMRWLREVVAQNRQVIIVLHDWVLASRFCHQLLLLHEGTLVASGAPSLVLSRHNCRQYFGISPQTHDAGNEICIIPWQEPQDVVD